MVIYQDGGKRAIYNGYKFTRDEKTGYYLSSCKINGKRRRLHTYVWESIHGEIPEGFHVHHIDTDKNNNDESNLELEIPFNHLSLHGKMADKEAIERFQRSGIEASKEWHRSSEGKEFHRKIAIESWKTRGEHEYKCTNCEKQFRTKKIYTEKSNFFCSGGCKSDFRRKLGVDNEARVCTICGAEFIIRKYQNTKTCSLICRGKFKTLNAKQKQ
jgi:uncharacterized C2H2 Zn-finger protein